jgi:hypothetical protein
MTDNKTRPTQYSVFSAIEEPLDRVAGAAMLKVLLILSSPVPMWDFGNYL